jgi:hypothetical protein
MDINTKQHEYYEDTKKHEEESKLDTKQHEI